MVGVRENKVDFLEEMIRLLKLVMFSLNMSRMSFICIWIYSTLSEAVLSLGYRCNSWIGSMFIHVYQAADWSSITCTTFLCGHSQSRYWECRLYSNIELFYQSVSAFPWLDRECLKWQSCLLHGTCDLTNCPLRMIYFGAVNVSCTVNYSLFSPRIWMLKVSLLLFPQWVTQ